MADLAVGDVAVVGSIEGQGSEAARRLRDLGFLPGTRVKVVRRAPLRDPVCFELRGYQICIRRRDAAMIGIEAGALAS